MFIWQKMSINTKAKRYQIIAGIQGQKFPGTERIYTLFLQRCKYLLEYKRFNYSFSSYGILIPHCAYKVRHPCCAGRTIFSLIPPGTGRQQ